MKQSARAFIGIVALISLGFALGVVTDRLWLPRPGPMESQEGVRGRLMEDLRMTVGLSDEQTTAVHTIFNRYQVLVAHAWDELQPQLQVALDSALVQINAVLDPDQVDTFREWWAETHRHRAQSSR